MNKIEHIEGVALPLRGDDIDTDRIIPARYLRAVTFDGLETHVFEDDRKALASSGGRHRFDEPDYADAAILLVNRNFGCGSSREHAPQALLRRGIRAVVGESFSEIFFGNAVLLGIPCVSVSHDAIDALMSAAESRPRDLMVVSLSGPTVQAGSLSVVGTLPAAARDAFLKGLWDPTSLLLDRFDEVRAVARDLPYTRGFTAA